MPDMPTSPCGLIPTIKAPASVRVPAMSPQATSSFPHREGDDDGVVAGGQGLERGRDGREGVGGGQSGRIPTGFACREPGLDQRRDDVADLVAIPLANLGGDPRLLRASASGGSDGCTDEDDKSDQGQSGHL